MRKQKRARGRPEPSAWVDAEAWGCDTTQLAHHLTLTVLERLRRHDRALSAARALRNATEKKRART